MKKFRIKENTHMFTHIFLQQVGGGGIRTQVLPMRETGQCHLATKVLTGKIHIFSLEGK
jgi:hypothetical protein